jgi:acyl-coenzyme A thioesterase PaaI-like protein
LGISDWVVDLRGESVVATAACPDAQAGGPQIAHGGWTAAVFDDVLGRLPGELGERAVTAELHVRYRKPVPTQVPVLVRAAVVGREGRDTRIVGDLVLAAAPHVVLATAEAVLTAVDDTHVARHREWLAEQGIGADPPAARPRRPRDEPPEWAGLLDDWEL